MKVHNWRCLQGGEDFYEITFTLSQQHDSFAKLQGQWKDGMRDGVGQQTWPDGACYSGQCAAQLLMSFFYGLEIATALF